MKTCWRRNCEGVPRHSGGAFMWVSFAGKRGDAGAKAGPRDLSRTMTR